jgi:hypothetical protein
MSHITIVGNAPLAKDLSLFVNSSDIVVRFNWPATWAGNSGTRFDIWVIANGRGGRKFVEQQTFIDAAFKHLPGQIWFPRALGLHKSIPLNPLYGGALGVDPESEDVAREILSANELPQPYLHFNESFYSRCIRSLYDNDCPHCYIQMPSAGFMATQYVLENMPDDRLSLIGFGFEGWAGHPWELERSKIKSLANQGVLELIDP